MHKAKVIQLKVTVPCPGLQFWQSHALAPLQLHYSSDFLTPRGIWGSNHSNIYKVKYDKKSDKLQVKFSYSFIFVFLYSKRTPNSFDQMVEVLVQGFNYMCLTAVTLLHSTYPWCLDEPEGDAPHRVRWSCSHHSWWCRHWCDPWSNIRRLYTQRCLLEYRQAHTRRTMWCKGNTGKITVIIFWNTISIVIKPNYNIYT